ncbi:MAG: hypothetical protein GYA17_20200 [Chloroflexi bacterium]|nr:hypothetical protein [Chloroflexota bacterium]
MLTRGGPLGFSAVLANLHPHYGSYLGVAGGRERARWIGQLRHMMGERSARVSFLMPTRDPQSTAALDLIEGLVCQAGDWGAYHVLADVEERSPVFEFFRRAGFSVYARQQIYRLILPGKDDQKRLPKGWTFARQGDEAAIRLLYQSLVPPLVQSAESFSSQRLQGLVFRYQDDVQGYVDIVAGPRGIFLQPLIHPSLEDAAPVIYNLVWNLFPLLGRPVYIAVRSYQAWLHDILEKMPAQPGPKQTLMVKHLANTQRALNLNSHLAVVEKHQIEPTVPMVQNLMETTDQAYRFRQVDRLQIHNMRLKKQKDYGTTIYYR